MDADLPRHPPDWERMMASHTLNLDAEIESLHRQPLLFLEEYTFKTPTGVEARCVFDARGRVIFDRHGYADLLRRQVMSWQ